ncbi:hypothetical protein GEMRC1_012652 [Eukaryota sp. GEM-RC1]
MYNFIVVPELERILIRVSISRIFTTFPFGALNPSFNIALPLLTPQLSIQLTEDVTFLELDATTAMYIKAHDKSLYFATIPC